MREDHRDRWGGIFPGLAVVPGAVLGDGHLVRTRGMISGKRPDVAGVSQGIRGWRARSERVVLGLLSAQ